MNFVHREPGPRVETAIVLLAMALGAFLAWPHLGEAIWQDEAFTIFNFSSSGIAYPFVHYTTANSHMGFSAALAAWIPLFPNGAEPFELRILPLIFFLAAIALVYLVGRRLGGTWCGILACALFATSPIAENFSTQLRGYGPSWPFIAALLLGALNSDAAEHRYWWRGLYAIGALGAIAILPTNLFFCGVVAVVVLSAGRLSPLSKLSTATTIWLLVVPPLALFVAYGLVWKQLTAASHLAYSAWSRSDLLSNWLRGTSADLAFMAPVALGLVVAAIWHSRIAGNRDTRSNLVLSVGLLAGLPVALYAMPLAPFPRTLVPYLPIWTCAIAALVTAGIIAVRSASSARACVVVIAAGYLALAAASPIQRCRGSSGQADPFHYDLCHQYFRDRYEPEQVLMAWVRLGREDRPIVTDFEGYFALRSLSSALPVIEYRSYQASGPSPVIVANGPAQMELIRRSVAPAGTAYREIADTGYFHVFAPAK